MVNEDAKKVWAYIDEHEQEYIDLLKKYCAQPSVSHRIGECVKWRR